MSTSVVNVKVAHIRPTYKDLSAWCADPRNVYIGRGGVVFVDCVRYPKKDSVWANPFKIGPSRSRDDVIASYETYIRAKLVASPELRAELEGLRGKNLGCWCAPEPCHGDVLLKLLAEYSDPS